MNKTLYVCRSCGYGFPKELSELIDNKTQVYCEMCGTPFSLAGIIFKQASVKTSGKSIPIHPRSSIKGKKISKLEKAIKRLDKFDYVPMVIFSLIVLIFNLIFINTFNLLHESSSRKDCFILIKAASERLLNRLTVWLIIKSV